MKVRRFWNGSTTRRLSFGLMASAVVLLSNFATPADAGKRNSHKKGRSLDARLQAAIKRGGIKPLDAGPSHSMKKVLLGQMLFFDKELSGNRDISCATCHHPDLFTGDFLSLSVGTKGTDGIGPLRQLGDDRIFIPRNSPEIFNRGSVQWTSMFWDSRIEITSHGRLISPAGDQLPAGLDSVLAVQAMFPVTSRDEMRGLDGDKDVNDKPNELGHVADDDLQGMWDGLMKRLLAIPAYRVLFADAYPGIAQEKLGFQHAANAIAAFETTAFTFLDSPWDKYVAGDRKALSTQQKRGAVLFFGKANCAKCHSGSLLTDQRHHNIGVPQLGPGKEPESPFDFGRFRETDNIRDLFAFRTPPLRNVAVTGPWMHNGAYTTLEGAVRHHLNPKWALLNYDVEQLDERLQPTVIDERAVTFALLAFLDPKVRKRVRLKDREVDDLLAFLNALTSPSLGDLPKFVPKLVPSGLPVDTLFGVDD